MLDAGTHSVVPGSIRESVRGAGVSQMLSSNSYWLNNPAMMPCHSVAFEEIFDVG